jgi:hypothetical protein
MLNLTLTDVRHIDLSGYRQWKVALRIPASRIAATATITRRGGQLAIEAFGETRYAAVAATGPVAWEAIAETVAEIVRGLQETEGYRLFALASQWPLQAAEDLVEIRMVTDAGRTSEAILVRASMLPGLLADDEVVEIRIRRPSARQAAA